MPSLKFLEMCKIHDITKYVKTWLNWCKKYWLKYSKTALPIMSILQATPSYSITHKFFKTFRTCSQEIKLESWKDNNTQLPKTILMRIIVLSIQISISLSTLSSSVTVEWIFNKQIHPIFSHVWSEIIW